MYTLQCCGVHALDVLAVYTQCVDDVSDDVGERQVRVVDGIQKLELFEFVADLLPGDRVHDV